MEVTSTASEAYEALTTEEEIHCHKARIFSLLTKAPAIVRAWKNAICDGAVYLGKGPLPASYADRYFAMSPKDISYVTFSIVTVFEETALGAEGQEIEGFQCHISPAQREASEFLIVTFSNDHDRIALLPRRLYYPEEGPFSTPNDGALPDEISASTLFEYTYSIKFLLAYIEEIRRITVRPMHPTTTPFQIGLDGRIPRAGFPMAIKPQESEEQSRESKKEIALRTIHKMLPQSHPMKVDFLDYQPLLRDFKIVISSCETFPRGLEAVISHTVGRSDTSEKAEDSHHLRYADYLLTHGITRVRDYAFFVPRRLIPENWFVAPHPAEAMPAELHDSVSIKDFIFAMDDTGTWVQQIWRIISAYPPGEYPTPAEEKQENWKKAFPWPEIEAQVALQEASTPQEARGHNEQRFFKDDSGTGDDGAVRPSDASLLAAHYMKNLSLDENQAEKDAAESSDH